MSEDGFQEDKVKAGILVWKAERDVPLRPIDPHSHNIEARIGTLGAEKTGQRRRHNTDPTPNVEHSMVGLHSTQIDKIAEVLLIYLLVVGFAADEPEAMRRD